MTERPLACPEWREDLAGWLVGQLPPVREAVLDAHLATCAVCRAEADSLLGVAAVGLGVDPTGGKVPVGPSPSPGLPDRIVAQVTAERRGRRTVRWSLALAVAAIAVAVIVATRPDPTPPLHGHPVTFAVRPAGVTAEAVVAAEPGGSVVALAATGLEPDTTYALWLTPNGGGYADRVAAGTFRPDGQGRVDERLHSALPVTEMDRVWVTDPAGAIALDTKPA